MAYRLDQLRTSFYKERNPLGQNKQLCDARVNDTPTLVCIQRGMSQGKEGGNEKHLESDQKGGTAMVSSHLDEELCQEDSSQQHIGKVVIIRTRYDFHGAAAGRISDPVTVKVEALEAWAENQGQCNTTARRVCGENESHCRKRKGFPEAERRIREISQRKKQAPLPETRNLNARRKKNHVHVQSGGERGEAGEASVGWCSLDRVRQDEETQLTFTDI